MTEKDRTANGKSEPAMKMYRVDLETAKALAPLLDVIIKGTTEGELIWFVLRDKATYHLVPGESTHAYCGWKVNPDAEKIPPPQEGELEKYRPIAQGFCLSCARAARTIDSFLQELRKE